MRNFKVYFLISIASLLFGILTIYFLDRLIGTKLNDLYNGYNHKGYRGIVKKAKPKNYKRIAMFGGSVIGGYGVNYRDAIPFLLENKFSNKNIDVVNLGMNGNGIYGINKDVKSYLYLDYDIAVIHNGYNDCTIKRFNKSNTRNSSFFFRNFNYLPIIDTYVQEKLYLILNSNNKKENHEIISEYYEKKAIKTKHIRPLMCFDNVNNNISDDEIKIFKKHLQSFYVPKYTDTLNFLEKKNIMTIVIIQPSYNDIRQKIQSDILREISKKFETVYLLDLSNKIDILDIKISYDKMHNTKLGNQITTDFIYKKIITLIKNNLT